MEVGAEIRKTSLVIARTRCASKAAPNSVNDSAGPFSAIPQGSGLFPPDCGAHSGKTTFVGLMLRWGPAKWPRTPLRPFEPYIFRNEKSIVEVKRMFLFLLSRPM